LDKTNAFETIQMTNNLVLVHLNTEIPKYLSENISTLQHLFPEISKTLIISEGMKFQAGQNDISIRRVNSNHYDDFFKSTRHEREFRHGFWRTSIERLLHLCDFICQGHLEDSIHIESDILLFKGFPFGDFKNLPRIYWQEYNSERDVASILYIRDANEANWLKQELINQITSDQYVTDMSALNRIRKSHPERIGIIPSINEVNFDLKNEKYFLGHDNSAATLALKPGIYDSAQVGMWLLGMDPRNTYGVEILHGDSIIENGEGLLDPRKATYCLTDDNQIIARTGDVQLPILSIHVHSKEPNLFKANQRLLEEYLNLASNPLELRKFKFEIFGNMFLESVKSGRVMNFVLGIPIIYRLRRIVKNLFRKW
jgi:hypothetical protein